MRFYKPKRPEVRGSSQQQPEMTIHLYCMLVQHEADGRGTAPRQEQPDMQQG
jgi:hypothetical protein